MLDFAVDPGWIALAGTIGGGVILKGTENLIGKKKAKNQLVVVKPAPATEKPKNTDVFLCQVWEIRHKEANPFYGSDMRKVPLADMTVCADPECANCEPTHAAIQEIKNREFAEALRKERKIEAEKKRKAEFQKKLEETKKRALAKRAAEIEERKFSVVGGMKIRRPKEVPYGAKGHIDRNPQTWRDYVVWKWNDPSTGFEMFYKQPIDVDNYEEVSMDGAIVLQWQAVYDPVTGEHLGDYRRLPDTGTELRDPVEKKPNKFEQEKHEKVMRELEASTKAMYHNLSKHDSDHKAIQFPKPLTPEQRRQVEKYYRRYR